MLAERERRLELLLERVDAQRLEPPRLAAEPRRVSEPLQRAGRATARAPRRRRPRPRAHRPRERGARLPEQLLEPQRVHARRGQRVAVGRRDDRLVPERGAQTRHVVLHGVPRRRGQILSPQSVDQLVDVTTRPLPKGEQREQRMRLLPLDGHRASAGSTSKGPRSRISSGSLMRTPTG